MDEKKKIPRGYVRGKDGKLKKKRLVIVDKPKPKARLLASTVRPPPPPPPKPKARLLASTLRPPPPPPPKPKARLLASTIRPPPPPPPPFQPDFERELNLDPMSKRDADMKAARSAVAKAQALRYGGY